MFKLLHKVLFAGLVCALLAPAAAAFAAPKVGFLSGTTSQNEEEYRVATEMVEKYGADRVIHLTYPDMFMNEQETTIQQILNMATDPEVKAIFLNQAVPGCVAGIQKVKEFRPDIFFISNNAHEDPLLMASVNDIVLDADHPVRGEMAIPLAAKMGAKTYFHYSFPRHMSRPLNVERVGRIQRECEKYGITFVSVNAPDPTGDAGVAGTQQFMIEDIPRQVAKYGNDSVFFGTNVSMMEPMIRSAVNAKAMVIDLCDPSPYLGYPGALGISIPSEKRGDVAFALDAIQTKLNEAGVTGRFATPAVPYTLGVSRAAVEYCFDVAEGRIKGYDRAHMESLIRKNLGQDTQIRTYNEETGNFLLTAGEYYLFDKK
ncbi:DUF3798 domain-containing protein [Desulfovibrio sp. OttesenSCG-928-I05]|nr:DUF3798 domain-containing protein [Desulfovibrio sp. OttesenSCG-928-I05]